MAVMGSPFLEQHKLLVVLWKRAAVRLSSLPLPTALTSALYMRIRPWLTLDQEGTALMFQSWLECSAKGPVFI